MQKWYVLALGSRSEIGRRLAIECLFGDHFSDDAHVVGTVANPRADVRPVAVCRHQIGRKILPQDANTLSVFVDGFDGDEIARRKRVDRLG